MIGIEKCQPWVKNANLGQGYVQFVAEIFLKHTNKILNVLKILNKKNVQNLLKLKIFLFFSEALSKLVKSNILINI